MHSGISTLFNFYLKFIKSSKWIFISLFAIGLVTWPIDLVLPAYLHKLFVDRVSSGNTDLWYIVVPLFLIFLEIVIHSLLNRIYDMLWLRFIPRFKRDIRDHMFAYVHGHSHSFFLENMSGSIGQWILQVANLAEEILGSLVALLLPLLLGMGAAIFLAARIDI